MNNFKQSQRIKKSSLPFIFSRIMPAIAIVLFFIVGFTIFTSKEEVAEPSIQNFRNWQEADTPFGYPLIKTGDSDIGAPRQKFDSHFHFHSPWERAAIPRTEQFEAAMGTETGSYTYNAQPFNAMNNLRGGNHSGDDINGIGGKNSDLGDPIYAVANGLVVYVGKVSAGWGNCIILAHRTPEGKILHSMYAHLNKIHVAYKEQIPRGGIIGTVGNANGNYLAHLHLEMRESDGVSPFLSGYPSLIQHDRLNPSKVISNYMAKGENILNPSILNIAQLTQLKKNLSMDSNSAMNLMKFMQNASKETPSNPDKK